MELQCISCGFPSPLVGVHGGRVPFSQRVSTSLVGLRGPRVRTAVAFKSSLFKGNTKEFSTLNSKGGVHACASSSNPEAKIDSREANTTAPGVRLDGAEPFRGKSGSVSFYGLTQHMVEEGKLMSSPFKEDKGSFLWVLAPAALLSSLLLPQFFVGGAIEALFQKEILVDIVSSLVFEVLFYMGLATFLLVTDRVQRPYLQFSAKRWGLITGLKGYLASAFFTAGFKVVVPLFAVYVTWPMIGLPALIAVAPFLFGCLAQLAFEASLERRGSSCWPLVPIIFEIYRLYQLTKAAYFMEKLMFQLRGLPSTPEVVEKGGAIFSMIVTFQVLGVVCLWSLMAFLLRLFPSRPVAENY